MTPLNTRLQPWQRLALAVVSGVLMAVPFLYAPYYLLMWVAFVPLLFALQGVSLTNSYALGLVTGLVSCMLAMYWITDFGVITGGASPARSLFKGSILWLASAQALALLAAVLTGLRRLHWRQHFLHDFILFPVVFAAAFALTPQLFPFHPADTQSRFLSAIQAIEWTGIAGLDALIGLSNIMLYKGFLLLRRALSPPGQGLGPPPHLMAALIPWITASVLIVMWFGYGAISYRLWDNYLAQWQTVPVGLVQPNDVPTLARPRVPPGYSLAHPPEMALTQQLAKAGAVLVVWPEARYKGYFDNPHVQYAYAQQLAEAGTHLLFQDTEKVNDRHAGPRQFNTAKMIDAKGVAQPPYRKIKTMLFGESLPFNGAVSWLNRISQALLGDFVTPVSSGTEPALFSLNNHLKVVPLICYETGFPRFVANALPSNSSGNGTVLVAISNDGWFGQTAQPFQHVNASLLRAVENRVPFVHVVNNGPSLVVLPNGRILFQAPAFEAGGYLVDVPYLAPGVGTSISEDGDGQGP
ncbi:MAG: apolipoprotein N-acyltransferase [Halomonadaceae bacterium]|nr:MAG: apolipoprotein N-acyltransferase [Halomonadaceae bacterium]